MSTYLKQTDTLQIAFSESYEQEREDSLQRLIKSSAAFRYWFFWICSRILSFSDTSAHVTEPILFRLNLTAWSGRSQVTHLTVTFNNVERTPPLYASLTFNHTSAFMASEPSLYSFISHIMMKLYYKVMMPVTSLDDGYIFLVNGDNIFYKTHKI